ncbi:hypothetical protein ACOMHN_010486 [Nucella lapillus]
MNNFVVLCASPDAVRKIMIQAHELNFDNGEYVFFNIDLFTSIIVETVTMETMSPWKQYHHGNSVQWKHSHRGNRVTMETVYNGNTVTVETESPWNKWRQQSTA